MTSAIAKRAGAKGATVPAASPAVSTMLKQATVRTLITATEAGVETDEGESIHARQAASCLLSPAIGDKVLLCHAGEEAYVLAVLEREGRHSAEISVPGAGTVAITASQKLELNAPAMSLAAHRLTFLADAVTQMGQTLTSNFRNILETVVDKTVGARTLTTTAETRTSAIRDVEILNAGTLVQTVEKVATQTSEIALVTATRDVRLDGERVSVG